MIRVVVELWPNGDEQRSEILGQLAIANVTPYDDPASYIVAVVGADGELRDVHRVDGHRRADGWQTLVSAALSPDTVAPSEEAEALAVSAAERLRRQQDRDIEHDV
jgi:hypothetical protein